MIAWILLVAGVAIWFGAHWVKRLAPDMRASLGEERGKGIIALTLGAAIVLMVIGYRATPFITVWSPPSFLTHINNLLMVGAIFLMSPAPKKGALIRMRHPMLTGFALWTVAHLLVNGDLTAILTFGPLLIWAVMSMRLINTAEPDWTAPPKGHIKYDAMMLAGSVILVGVVGGLHALFGLNPFG